MLDYRARKRSVYDFVPQNALDIELCLRITTGKPAPATETAERHAHRKGGVGTDDFKFDTAAPASLKKLIAKGGPEWLKASSHLT
jgi:hypothetical protein